jgi:hypothetical protein
VLFEDVPQVSLRDVTVLRYAGGLFSVALSVAQPHRAGLNPAPHTEACNSALRQACVASPLMLSGALPSQEFRSSQNEERASERCPDFPPAEPSCDDQASDHPARPPFLLYLDRGTEFRAVVASKGHVIRCVQVG